MKRFIYLISPQNIRGKKFYKDLNKVLKTKKIKYFQLRLKNISTLNLLKISKKIKKIVKKNGVKFIIITLDNNGNYDTTNIIDSATKVEQTYLSRVTIGRQNANDNRNGAIDGIEIDVDYMAVPNSSEYDTEFAHSLKKATENSLDRTDINWVPSVATGFTDSRFLRPLGTTTYGFNGMDPSDDPLLNRMHGTDESIGIKSLTTGAKIMLALAIDRLPIAKQGIRRAVGFG